MRITNAIPCAVLHDYYFAQKKTSDSFILNGKCRLHKLQHLKTDNSSLFHRQRMFAIRKAHVYHKYREEKTKPSQKLNMTTEQNRLDIIAI